VYYVVHAVSMEHMVVWVGRTVDRVALQRLSLVENTTSSRPRRMVVESSLLSHQRGRLPKVTAMLRSGALVLSVLCVGMPWHCVECLHLRAQAGAPNPLENYFRPDKSGLNIFDYSAAGIAPDKFEDLSEPLSRSAANPADPSQGSPQRAHFRKLIETRKEMEEWLGGRKVFHDCPTFPYCNHIPAPPPVFPMPSSIQQVDPHLHFPWNPDKHEAPDPKEVYTQVSPSADPQYTKIHDKFMKRIYKPALGYIGAPGGNSGVYTLARKDPKEEPREQKAWGKWDYESRTLTKVTNAGSDVARAGIRDEAEPNTDGYQPPAKPNQSFQPRKRVEDDPKNEADSGKKDGTNDKPAQVIAV
jgi:hypothetical protein